jgi:hypothetical protein
MPSSHLPAKRIIILSRPGLEGLPSGVRRKWDARTAEGWYQLAEGACAIVNLAEEKQAVGHHNENGVKSRGIGQAVLRPLVSRHQPRF